MKKVLAVFIALIACVSIMAQEHLKFKGIPIEGNLRSFCQKLEAKGFDLARERRNYAMFYGDFIGHNTCITVKATSNGDNVYAVIVLFESSETWTTLVNHYDYCKDLYAKKYGTPIISEENNPAKTKSNTELMNELYSETAPYYSIWAVMDGFITIAIGKSENSGGHVSIVYLNKQNSDINTKNDLEDI